MVRAAQLDVEFTTSGIDTVNRAVDGLNVKLGAIGVGLTVVGAKMTSAFTRPIVGFMQEASMAAWNQVDAVEQATSALSAYEKDASKVEAVLKGLLDYARSDMGVLFSRQELFAAAQSMKIYGAETENLTHYTEVLSRSVGLGLSNWDDLNTIIGRVGATGKLTGNDFDMLKARGFQLDESLRGANVTWETLFAALDKGFPADAMAGQADTIRGKTIRLKSAMRDLGNAFLGVDRDTSKFIKGGLGWQMVRGLEKLRELMRNAAPAVAQLGSAAAAVAKPVSAVLELMTRLPAPVLAVGIAIAGLVAAIGPLLSVTGMMMVGIAALPAAFAAVATGASAFMAALVPLLPVIGAVTVAVGLLFAAYKTNFLGFGDLVDGALGKLKDFFAVPDAKSVNLMMNTSLDDPEDNWNRWEILPDGSMKHIDLGITTKPQDGRVEEVLDPATGQKSWLLHVDIDGDSNPDATRIIDSRNQGGGKYVMLIEVDGKQYQAWYDEKSGETLIVPLDFDDRPAISKWQALKWTIERDGLFDTLGSAFAAMLQGMSNAAMAWLNDQGNKWASRFGDAFDIIKGKWNAWMDNITESTAFTTVIGWIDDIRTGLEAVQRIWNAVFGSDDSNIPETSERAGGVTYTPRLPKGETDNDPERRSPNQLMSHGIGNVLGQQLRDATSASDMFNKSMAALGATAQQSSGIFTQTASTVNVYRGSTDTAKSATSTMASSMGASFGSMSSSALTAFSTMQAETTSKASTMQVSVVASMLGMKTNSAVQMALMAATASTTGTQMNAGMTGWLAGAQARIAASMLSIVSTIRGIASSGYDAGYYAGSMISQGFASGMLAYLGVIRGAASQMVAAASQAVIAKAMIASPSKLFHQYGAYIGEGLERGILSTVGDVGRASDMLIGATLPQPGFAGGFGGATVIDNSQVHYIALTESDFQQLLAKSERGNQAADHLIGARNTNGFVGRGGV